MQALESYPEAGLAVANALRAQLGLVVSVAVEATPWG
jgi:hypothetical protein